MFNNTSFDIDGGERNGKISPTSNPSVFQESDKIHWRFLIKYRVRKSDKFDRFEMRHISNEHTARSWVQKAREYLDLYGKSNWLQFSSSLSNHPLTDEVCMMDAIHNSGGLLHDVVSSFSETAGNMKLMPNQNRREDMSTLSPHCSASHQFQIDDCDFSPSDTTCDTSCCSASTDTTDVAAGSDFDDGHAVVTITRSSRNTRTGLAQRQYFVVHKCVSVHCTA